MRRDEILPLSEMDLCYFDSRGGMYICLHCESLKTSMNNTDISIFNENAHYAAGPQHFPLVLLLPVPDYFS